MGPRSENRGYSAQPAEARGRTAASMGPRSENRGYLRVPRAGKHRMHCFNGSTVREPWLLTRISAARTTRARLQWVHGPRTVVIYASLTHCVPDDGASMGPRSENRGYFLGVEVEVSAAPNASMGPRSENRGYSADPLWPGSTQRKLQWVHGPRTVVIIIDGRTRVKICKASMGPRSENRGYSKYGGFLLADGTASMGPRSENRGYCAEQAKWHDLGRLDASMGPRSENRGYCR